MLSLAPCPRCCPGSFSRTAVNAASGAQSALSSVFASLVVLIAVYALGPGRCRRTVMSLAELVHTHPCSSAHTHTRSRTFTC